MRYASTAYILVFSILVSAIALAANAISHKLMVVTNFLSIG